MEYMMSGMDVYTRQFRVRYSETGSDGLLKPVQVFKYFQDAASEHAYEMGVSGLHLRPRNLAWVILQYRVKFLGYPRWNQTVYLKTWRHAERNLYEIRTYEIRDEQEQLLTEGKSVWVIIDAGRKRPVRLKNNMPPGLMTGAAPVENSCAEIPALSQPEFEQIFCIRRQDLDFNGHVNNTVFIEWALETVPELVVQHLLPCETEVNFLGDVGYGDTVKSQAQRLSNDMLPIFLYRITDNLNGHEKTRLRISWKQFC
jgi:medium-chain acyl-[acyl-carrier-protein] hydrolase